MKRVFVMVLFVSLLLLALPRVGSAQANGRRGTPRTDGGPTQIFSPEQGRYLPVVDRRAEMAEITRQTPRNRDLELHFLRGKRRQIESRPDLPAAERERALRRIDGIIARAGREQPYPMPYCDGPCLEEPPPDEGGGGGIGITQPDPGGVGYGVFYDPTFQHAFDEGSGIVNHVVTPTTAGGNNTTWLYLTSTNRTAKGVEAFPAYFAQGTFSFLVFDWANEQNHWQVNMPFSVASRYLYQIPLYNDNEGYNGYQMYQNLNLFNQTYHKYDNVWTNEVYLLNPSYNGYDLIYSYDYVSSPAAQKDSFFGSWGPIVETFQEQYSNMNRMGFAYIQILTYHADGTYDWVSLRPWNSYTRNDNHGFTLFRLDPNWVFLVN